MAMRPGSCWASATWADTSWKAGSWVSVAVSQTLRFINKLRPRIFAPGLAR